MSDKQVKKWKAYQVNNSDFTQIYEGEKYIAECSKNKTAQQICLMHNKGIELLRQIDAEAENGHILEVTHSATQDFLKRMQKIICTKTIKKTR